MIQAPIVHCGHLGSSAHTSQVSLDVTATLSNLNLLGLAASSTVTFSLSLADATGTLTKIVCGPPDGMDVAVASSLAQISTGLSVDLKLLGLWSRRSSATSTLCAGRDEHRSRSGSPPTATADR